MNRRHVLTSVAALAAALSTGPGLHADDDAEAEALRWTWRVETVAGTSDAITLVATARIADGYIVYGSDFKSGIGPRPSRLKLAEGSTTQIDGELASVAPRRRTDKAFGTEYSYFEHQAEFRQRLRRPAGATRVAGRIEGQTCFEKDGTCTLFRQAFDLSLPLNAGAASLP